MILKEFQASKQEICYLKVNSVAKNHD